MLHIERHFKTLPCLISILILTVAMFDAPTSLARAAAPTQKSANSNPARTATPSPATTRKADDASATPEPAFQEYKGVRIGMSADEARKKLGTAADKSDAQDFYVFSENETAQVFYDASKKVSALAIVYAGKGAGAPDAKAVLGVDVEAKPDGSVYKLERYPKAGFWVSYSRTAGDSPLVSITMQKIQ